MESNRWSKELLKEIPEHRYYWPVNLARFLGVSRRTVYKWIEEGKLGAVRVGGRLRIPREALKVFLEG